MAKLGDVMNDGNIFVTSEVGKSDSCVLNIIKKSENSLEESKSEKNSNYEIPLAVAGMSKSSDVMNDGNIFATSEVGKSDSCVLNVIKKSKNSWEERKSEKNSNYEMPLAVAGMSKSSDVMNDGNILVKSELGKSDDCVSNIKKESENALEENESEKISKSNVLEFCISDELVHENEILEENMKREEEKIKSTISADSGEENLEKKTKKLMYLLTRTQFYSKYLSEKINSSKESASVKENEKLVTTSQPRKRKRVETCDENKEGNIGGSSEGPSKVKRSKRKGTVSNGFDEKLVEECMQTLKESKNAEKKGLEVSHVAFEPPEFFVGILKDYQIEGLEWLVCLYENGINGILADEMGLGKTVQTIALICHLISKRTLGPFLIVAPLSTVSNWMIEFSKFAPEVPTLLFHGNKSTRAELAHSFKKKNLSNGYSMFPVIITTYEIPLAEQKFFFERTWKYIIVDEGHRLKNYKCQLARVLKQSTSENRLLLTGTPLQNNLEELWSLLNFILPEVFNDLALFESWLSMDQLNESNAIIEQEAQNKVVSTIHKILSPFILRRMKCDVNLNLPPKKEVLVYAPMTKLQWELYSATLDKTIEKKLGLVEDNWIVSGKRKRTENVSYNDSDDDINFEYNFSIGNKPGKMLENMKIRSNAYDCQTGSRLKGSILSSKNLVKDSEGNLCVPHIKMANPAMQLRKISNHPYLVQMPVDPSDGGLLVDENIIKKSGKMMVLDELLVRLKARGHKILLFSTFCMVLDLIEELLILRKYKFVRIDGAVHLNVRSGNINQFMSDPDTFVFLISTRAGGLGLNLTSADTVIIFDSDWNPQVDLQAQDRCHRIGQTKPVVVYRLVTKGSVDERIVDIAVKKKKLGKLILHKDMFKIKNTSRLETVISLEDLKELLESEDYSKVVHTSGNVLTEELLEEILDRSENSFPPRD